MISINKYNLKLRLADTSDAEFIISLRNDTQLGKYLSKTSPKLEDQINWLNEYKKREAQNLEYYFIALSPTNERLGTTRLYNFENDCFETGSWLFSKEAPQGAAIKADIMGREFGFETLKSNFCKFEVRKENQNVLKYHKSFKPELVGEDELNYYFKISKTAFILHSQKLIKLLN